jgi:hypothetical protein
MNLEEFVYQTLIGITTAVKIRAKKTNILPHSLHLEIPNILNHALPSEVALSTL